MNTITCRPGRIALQRTAARLLSAGLATLAVSAPAAPTAPTPTLADRLHANAVASFQSGRFPEAYGRFVALADAGHAPSAAVALWMCQNGLELFGKDWDCGGDQLEDWSKLAGVPTPVLQPRSYGRFVIGPQPAPPAVRTPRDHPVPAAPRR